MISKELVGHSTVSAMPFDVSPTSSPATPLSAPVPIWPFGYGKAKSSLVLPGQNPGWLRPKVCASSCPEYQSAKVASVSPVALTGTLPGPPGAPDGPEAVAVGSAAAGVEEEQPRIPPPWLDTSP